MDHALSIAEIRERCQRSRQSVFSDPISKCGYIVSPYFTFFAIRLGLSANFVSCLSFGSFSLGCLSMLFGGYWYLAGSLFFMVSVILDMADGEVARWRGTGSVRGQFVDWFLDVMQNFILVVGLVGVCRAAESYLDVLVNIDGAAIALAIVLFLPKVTMMCAWTVLGWDLLRYPLQRERKIDVTAVDTKSKSRKFWLKLLLFALKMPSQIHFFTIFSLELLVAFLTGYEAEFAFFACCSILVFSVWDSAALLKRLIYGDSLVDKAELIRNSSAEKVFPRDDFF